MTLDKKEISMDELGEALELAKDNLDEDKSILQGIVKFGNIEVQEIMRSRVDVVALDIKCKFSEVVTKITNSGFSRIPVYDKTFDQIKGVLYIKDLLPHLHKGDSFKWQTLLRPSHFTPESKKISYLLKEFQLKKIHMALVVDEYGGTSGLVTMEDILEEIVGDISDESDEDEVTYTRLDESNYLFEGKTLLNDFFKVLNLDDSYLDEVRGDAETLAGLILELNGEIPERNYQINYKHFIFTVRSVDKRRIKQIQVSLDESQTERQ
ncbi:MAG: CBS domain-containing protein [Bacteroidales bacterium]|nr:CBS domain-containing protein [Bacteroidales bacterium]